MSQAIAGTFAAAELCPLDIVDLDSDPGAALLLRVDPHFAPEHLIASSQLPAEAPAAGEGESAAAGPTEAVSFAALPFGRATDSIYR